MMWGFKGGLWLAAAAMMLDVAKGDAVTFNVAGFNGKALPDTVKAKNPPRKGVFQATPDTSLNQTFTWTAHNIRIKHINLLARNTATNTSSIIVQKVLDKDPAAGVVGPGGVSPSIEGEPTNVFSLDIAFNPMSGVGEITMDISKAIRGAQPLYFEAAWLYVFGNNAGQGGKSYSPAFAVVDISNTPDFLDAGEITELFVNDPYFPEEAAGGGGDGSDADGGNGSGSSTTDSAPKTTPTANDGKDGTAVVSGNSGPPVAAIVGGVVGGVLGLLLIACLIWFLLRKKRQQRDPALAAHPYAGVSRTRTDELMAEKEANLASSSHAAAAAGPGSPYSDAGAPDDQQARAVHHRSSLSAGAAAPLIPAAAAAAAVVSPTTPADVPPGYTPYTDRPASGAGTTEEPPAAAGGVASMLVEEGMTAEEIRRLEEEERAIDAAIERAVRRPTG